MKNKIYLVIMSLGILGFSSLQSLSAATKGKSRFKNARAHVQKTPSTPAVKPVIATKTSKQDTYSSPEVMALLQTQQRELSELVIKLSMQEKQDVQAMIKKNLQERQSDNTQVQNLQAAYQKQNEQLRASLTGINSTYEKLAAALDQYAKNAAADSKAHSAQIQALSAKIQKLETELLKIESLVNGISQKQNQQTQIQSATPLSLGGSSMNNAGRVPQPLQNLANQQTTVPAAPGAMPSVNESLLDDSQAEANPPRLDQRN